MMKKMVPISMGVLSLLFLEIGLAGSAHAQTAQQYVTATNPVGVPSTSGAIESDLGILYLQIQQLQAALRNATIVGATSSAFSRDLTLGDSGPDVRALQQFLNAQGGLARVAASGPGSAGNETGYYGLLTQTALARWQTTQGIAPAQGYFGSTTRALVIAEKS